MVSVFSRITVYFEQPFWVGVYERSAGGIYEVCKVTFGAEPKDAEVYAYLLANWRRLRFGAFPEAVRLPERRLSPKRTQREAKRQMQLSGAGTKAQQALQAQREQDKREHKDVTRERREAEKARRFQLREARRKEKHRGR